MQLRGIPADTQINDIPRVAKRDTMRMTISKALARLTSGKFEDLAPHIHRQRLVIEGQTDTPISDQDIKRYLSALSIQIDMVELIEPVTHRSDMYGWAGWIHWETSGAHFYAWEENPNFFSVDIYTCKAFSVAKAVSFTQQFLDATKVVHRAF